MAVTAQMVKELREITSAGMLDCKNALVETNGNLDEAIKLLREKGLAKAAKKAGRIADMPHIVADTHQGEEFDGASSPGIMTHINMPLPCKAVAYFCQHRFSGK